MSLDVMNPRINILHIISSTVECDDSNDDSVKQPTQSLLAAKWTIQLSAICRLPHKANNSHSLGSAGHI